MPDYGALGTLMDQGISEISGALGEAKQASRDRDRDVAAALDAATQSVLQQREGRVNLPLLMWASGMGQPTRAGSFAESMSNGLQQAGPALAADRREEMERLGTLNKLQLARAQAPHAGAMERLQMAGMPLEIAGKIGPTLLQMRELELFQKAFQEANGQQPPAAGAPQGGSPGGAPPQGVPPGGGGIPMPQSMPPGFGSPTWAAPPPGAGASVPTATLPPMGSPPQAQAGPGGPPPGAGPGGPPMAPPGAQAGAGEDGDPVAAQTVGQWVRMGEALLRSGSAKYLPAAQSLFSRAEAAAKDGHVVGPDGVVRILPGAIRAQVMAETAKLRAKFQVEAQMQPIEGVTPGGTKVRGTPGQLAGLPGGADEPPPAAPTAPVLEPNSSTLKPVLPPAPADGGWTRDRSIPPGTVQTGVSPQRAKVLEEAGKYEAELTDQAKSSDDINKQVMTIAHAYKQFTTGPYAQEKQNLANLAEVMGFKDLAGRIQEGDPAAYEMAKKNILGMALKTLKDANSRFTQSEFQKIATEGSPSGEIRPPAAHAMLREAYAASARDRDLASAWSAAQKEGWQNPLEFAARWRQANPKDAYLRTADRAIGNFRGMELPKAADDWVPGTVYVAPDSPRGAMADKLKARGIKPGSMFRMTPDRNFEPFTSFTPPTKDE